MYDYLMLVLLLIQFFTVLEGTGCPKVLNLNVRGDLVEGNVIRGCAEVAWCGGTPGHGVSR